MRLGENLAPFYCQLEIQEGAGPRRLRESPLEPAKVVSVGFEPLKVGVAPAAADIASPNALLIINE